MTMDGGAKRTPAVATFPIPASLQELEGTPYHLLPYPHDFDDEDEAARAASFGRLLRRLEDGNRVLARSGMDLFEAADDGADEGDGRDDGDAARWDDGARRQALYTLVRKSESLAPATRARLVTALCAAGHGLCEALASSGRGPPSSGSPSQVATAGGGGVAYVASQAFRDALACHVYMLFTIMFLTESKEKLGKSLGALAPAASGKTGKSRKGGKAKKGGGGGDPQGLDLAASRSLCAEAMHAAALAMSAHRSALWQRGVPDEAVVGLPCRIAYQMLEAATGVHARKASSGDRALRMIAATVDSAPCLLGTVVAALVDLLHTYEHMAPLCAELCTLVSEVPRNALAVELLREIGRLDTAAAAGGEGSGGMGAAGSKASGIKHVAPFLSELAAVRPRVVLANLSLLLPHLEAEPYALRSAIVQAVGHILVREDRALVGGVVAEEDADGGEGKDDGAPDDAPVAAPEEGQARLVRMAKTRRSLFDLLCERTRDVTSFTRATTLKVLHDLTDKQSLPLDRLMPVTAIAIDRLQDKTVMVRRYAMQVSATIPGSRLSGCTVRGRFRSPAVRHRHALCSSLSASHFRLPTISFPTRRSGSS